MICQSNGNGLYFGEVGKRVKKQSITLVRETGWESFYGFTYLQLFLDATGCLLVYMGTTPVKADLFGTIEADFTPKEHSIYNGVHQTKIQRIKY